MPVCTLAIGASYLSNRLLPSRPPAADRLAELDKARLAEALHLRRELGDSLWPEWGGADIPMVLYNGEYVFLTGYPDPPDGWTTVPAGEGRGIAWEAVSGDDFEGRTYYRQRLGSPDESPQAFTVMIGGRWVSSLPAYEAMETGLGDEFRADAPPVIRGILPYRVAARLFLTAAGGKDWYICALLHESFHAYQGIRNPGRLSDAETAFTAKGNRYPWDDAGFAEDWQLELDLLADAVQAKTDAEAAERAGRFLDQRRERRTDAGLDAGLIELEGLKEWEEGLAKYTELSIWRLAAETTGYSPLPEMDGDPGFVSYANFHTQWSQQIEQIRRMAGDEGDTRFYYSGLAQAALLDRLAPGWRRKAFDGNTALEDLLAEAIGEKASLSL
jgi:hypothetical protein